MRLLIPSDLTQRLRRELKRGGTQEIGGVLVGEHAAEDTFRLVDFSVQHSGGSQTHFVRDVAHNKAFLDVFFVRTGHNYQRYNYIGEWHSHPLFAATPSREDLATMLDIVRDPNVGVTFAILLIARICRRNLEISATAFTSTKTNEGMTVEFEQPNGQPGWLERFKNFLGL
jgi:proteasome lid subunit RPN8/RPN11